MKFRTFLRLFFLIVVIVPLVAIGAILLDLRVGHEYAKANEKLATGLRVAVAFIENARLEARDDARLIADDRELQEALEKRDDAAVRRRINVFENDLSKIRSVVISNGGREVFSDDTEEDAFAHATTAIVTSDEGRLGRVSVSVEAAEAIADATSKATGIGILAMRDGKLLHTTDTRVTTVPKAEGSDSSPAEGDELRSRRQVVSDAGGVVEEIAVFQASGAIQDNILRAQVRTGALLGGFFLFALLASTFLGRSLKRSVTRFIAAARRIAVGNYDERLPDEGDDEFDQLGRAFNDMSGQIETKITELENSNSELEIAISQAGTDELTGLANARALRAGLERELARGARGNSSLGFAFFDLDNFKAVNDNYGHRQGDRVLATVGDVLRELCREGIDVPARFGGDEFAVVLPDADIEGAFAFAERLRKAIAGLRIPEVGSDGSTPGGWVASTASFGVVAVPGSVAPDAGSVLEAADAALYRAKAEGKNRTERVDSEPADPV